MASAEAGDSAQNDASTRIPAAVFVDDVDEFMKSEENKTVEAVLRRLEEQHNKYKFMEYNLNTKKSRLKSQIPDIKTSLDIVQHMKSRKANVMLEYSLNDAEALLQKNHSAAVKSLEQVDTDIGFIRDQTTTIEVNMARVYNWDVKRRQSEKGTTTAPSS